MAWIPIITPDVQAGLNNAELSAYREREVAEADPLPSIITGVINLVRGHVATKYSLEATGIPPELLAPALDIVIYRLAKRLHTATEQQRKAAADDAEALLERVADGRFGLATEAAGSTGPGPLFTPRERSFERDDEEGL